MAKKYIDAEKLIKSVNNYCEGAKCALNPIDGDADYFKGKIDACKDIQDFITSLQQEQPKNYFFCQLGGTIPKCSDCLRNHGNSPYRAKDIDTWMQPTIRGTKQCSDYINSEQPEVELEKEIRNYNVPFNDCGWERLTYNTLKEIARHFYELGLNARKEE